VNTLLLPVWVREVNSDLQAVGFAGLPLNCHCAWMNRSDCLKMVVSAILAGAELWPPARWKRVATRKITDNIERQTMRMIFPGGKMPPSTAGTED
jgi:hypothetical protein